MGKLAPCSSYSLLTENCCSLHWQSQQISNWGNDWLHSLLTHLEKLPLREWWKTVEICYLFLLHRMHLPLWDNSALLWCPVNTWGSRFLLVPGPVSYREFPSVRRGETQSEECCIFIPACGIFNARALFCCLSWSLKPQLCQSPGIEATPSPLWVAHWEGLIFLTTTERAGSHWGPAASGTGTAGSGFLRKVRTEGKTQQRGPDTRT